VTTTQPKPNRLFVAIGLPFGMTEVFAQWQQMLPKHCQQTPRENMHITLQFIGAANRHAVHAALKQISAKSFKLHITRFGYFRSDSGAILWAGVTPRASLLRLQGSITAALATLGISSITSDYRPHLTLARCSSDVNNKDLAQLLAQKPPRLTLSVLEFGLYSSQLGTDASSYQCLHHYSLSDA